VLGSPPYAKRERKSSCSSDEQTIARKLHAVRRKQLAEKGGEPTDRPRGEKEGHLLRTQGGGEKGTGTSCRFVKKKERTPPERPIRSGGGGEKEKGKKKERFSSRGKKKKNGPPGERGECKTLTRESVRRVPERAILGPMKRGRVLILKGEVAGLKTKKRRSSREKERKPPGVGCISGRECLPGTERKREGGPILTKESSPPKQKKFLLFAQGGGGGREENFLSSHNTERNEEALWTAQKKSEKKYKKKKKGEARDGGIRG